MKCIKHVSIFTERTHILYNFKKMYFDLTIGFISICIILYPYKPKRLLNNTKPYCEQKLYLWLTYLVLFLLSMRSLYDSSIIRNLYT